ncbi:hypothetical protein [Actinomadura sp. 3N508]|uniref:hypothetical protein n=1 Tax=Actinomadura sp. 3N508 TaxID=3375153 RepID=UPI00379253A1
MFAALIEVVTGSRRCPKAALAMRLLLTALMSFTLTASAGINMAGERVCGRARTQWVLAVNMCWSAAVALGMVLIWLIIAYGWQVEGVLRLMIVTVHVLLFARLLGAVVAADTYVSEMLRGEEHWGFHIGSWVVAALTLVITFVVAVRGRPPRGHVAWRRRVNLFCGVTMAYLVLSLPVFDYVSASHASMWDLSRPTPGLRTAVYVTGTLVLILPLLALPLAVRAIPNTRRQLEPLLHSDVDEIDQPAADVPRPHPSPGRTPLVLVLSAAAIAALVLAERRVCPRSRKPS